MREYGQIQCSFWSDPDIRGLPDMEVNLAAYLLTGPHSNGLGCYRLPYKYIEADRPWSEATIIEGFRKLFEMGFCVRCERTEFVLIRKFLYWNPISNGNVAKARMKEFETVPRKSSIYRDLCHSCLQYGDHWPDEFETLLETVSKGYVEQEPTQPNPNQNQNQTTPEQKTLSVADATAAPAGDADSGIRNNGVPYRDIVAMYHRLLPELPTCAKLTDTRKGYLRQRWQEDLPDLDAWTRYFEIVRDSDFLMGRTPGTQGKPPFRADLEWLTKPSNIVKIIEGKYHRG